MTPKELEMLAAINRQREARSLPPLSPNNTLAEAARPHSGDLSRNPGLVHLGSDGRNAHQRVLAAGYPASRSLEVVGWGWEGEIAPMIDWWMNSPVHHDILLSTSVNEAGVGYVEAPGTQWGHYWTVDFGKRPGASSPIPVTPSSTLFNIWAYMVGDGRTYRVANAKGTYEIFQSQQEGDVAYQVKAWNDLSVVPYEQLIRQGDFICRDIDTSPGGGRYMRQFGAPWFKVQAREGESFTSSKLVQFFNIKDCSPSAPNSGQVTDTITFVAHYRSLKLMTGVEVEDVIVLRWEQGGELYHYARGYGLVQWSRVHNDPNSPAWSALSEMLPGTGHIPRMVIPCLPSFR